MIISYLFSFYISDSEPTSSSAYMSNTFYFLCRYQDKNTTALIMLKSSIRWLSFRGDLLSNLLVTSVSAGALFAMQSPGGYHQERLDVLSISLFRLVTRDALLHRAQLGWVHFGFNSMDCKQFSFPTETSDFFFINLVTQTMPIIRTVTPKPSE